MNEILKINKTAAKFISEQKLRSDKEYKLSQYVFPFDFKGKEYIFNTLTRQCYELDGYTLPAGPVSAEEIESSAELNELMRGHFLVPEDKDECAFYEGIYKLARTLSVKKGCTGYTILPTLACNARCVYCYEEGVKQVTMTPETVERTIEYIAETARPDTEICITWFGGEPLLCERIIDEICEGLDDRGVKYHSMMVSNGSLITEALAKKMAEKWKLRHVQISMDCGEDEYIRRKNYYDYKDYYRKVPENINILTKNNIAVSVRCNVDDAVADDMRDFVDYMAELIPDKSKTGLYFAPLYDAKLTDTASGLWDKIFDMTAHIVNTGFGSTTSVDAGKFKTISCLADNTYGAVVIAADGRLYKCEHCIPGTSFGDVQSGTTAPENIKMFTDVGAVREKCRDCVFLPECTPFSKCPVLEPNCRKIKEYMTRMALRSVVNGKKADRDSQIDIC